MGSMAIKEKEVLVTLNNKTIKYYEEKGYTIPRYLDNSSRYKVKRGTKITVSIEDLSEGSNIRVTKICDECGKQIPNKPYDAILISRINTDGKDRCFNCGKINGGKTKKENIRYEDSLKYWANENNSEYLLNEFSPKNNMSTDKIFKSSNDIYLWKCHKCNGEYHASINSRTNDKGNKKGRGCPYCAGQKVLIGFNDLWTTHSEVAKLLKCPQRGHEVTAGSSKKEIFICANCSYQHEKCIASVVRQGFNCSMCGDGVSYPEKFIISFLNQMEIQYETQKIFKWSKNVKSNNLKLKGNKKYDFFIPSLNCIIEVNGIQHYIDCGFKSVGGRNLELETMNDKLKEELAIKNGILNYIIIDARYSNLEWIKNSVLNSNLNKLINFSNVNWVKCDEYATNNLIKLACEYWNDGIKSTTEIGKILKSTRGTIVRYLKQGANLNWCDYEPKEELYKNWESIKKPVIQLTKGNEFIKEWESIKEAEKKLRIKNVSLACSGIYKTSAGFKWMYKTDYNQLIKPQI
jgi:hypothetical protein